MVDVEESEEELEVDFAAERVNLEGRVEVLGVRVAVLEASADVFGNHNLGQLSIVSFLNL